MEIKFIGLNLNIYFTFLIFVLFLLSLKYLIQYSSLMFFYSNPIKYIKHTFKEFKNVENFEYDNVNAKYLIEDNLVVIGDISLKAINNEENFIVNIIINELHESILNLPVDMDFKLKNVILINTLKELYRIFEKSVKNKSYEISNEIILKLRNISYNLLNNNYYNMIEIFYSDLVLNKYYDECLFGELCTFYTQEFNFHAFLKLYLKEDEDSLYPLELTINQLKRLEINNNIWDNILKWVVFDTCKSIVEFDNFRIFKNMVDNIPVQHLKQPSKIIYELILFIEPLKESHREIFEDINNEIELLSRRFDYSLSVSIINNVFNVINRIEEPYYGYGSLNDIEEFEKYINKFLIYARIYKEFFALGTFILYNFDKTKDNEKSIRYIKEIWNPTSTGRTSAIILNCPPPMDFDELWLFNLYLFGGVDSEIWTLNYASESLIDIGEYKNLYFILYFINTIPRDNYWTKEDYIILERIIGMKESLLNTIDIFNNVFHKYSDLIIYNNSESFQLTVIDNNYWVKESKKFIKNRCTELKRIKDNILLELDLDSSRIEKIKIEFSENYSRNHSRLLLNSIESELQNDLEGGTIINDSFNIPKSSLIKGSITSTPSIINLHLLYKEEIFFIEKIKELLEEPNEIVEQHLTETELVNKIFELAKTMTDNNLNPDLIIISYNFFNSCEQSGVFKNNFSANRTFEKENISLKVAIMRNVEYEDMYILDTTNMKAKYNNYDVDNLDNRLFIRISKIENSNLAKVDMESKIALNLGNSDNIDWIKLTSYGELQ